MTPKQLRERFSALVHQGTPSSCWPWLGGQRSDTGAGVYAGKAAHRLAWEYSGCKIPKGATLRHTCNTLLCCNPAHLELATRAETLTANAEGTRIRGDAVPRSKLTEAKVLKIREAYATGVSQTALAERYGVSAHSISFVVRRKSWAHVGGPIAAPDKGRKPTRTVRKR